MMEPKEEKPLRDVKELLRRYQAGERVFTAIKIDEEFHDSRGATLEGADLSHSWILADFRGGNLRGVSFHRCNVKTCDFRGADLTGDDFTEAAIDGADFVGAILDEANFGGAGSYGYIFEAGQRLVVSGSVFTLLNPADLPVLLLTQVSPSCLRHRHPIIPASHE